MQSGMDVGVKKKNGRISYTETYFISIYSCCLNSRLPIHFSIIVDLWILYENTIKLEFSQILRTQ